MSRVIDVHGLSYRYPDGTRALDGVDFHLDAGETVAVFGANGSGKTTFVLLVSGLLSGGGSVQTGGARIGLVFQDPDEQLFMPTVLEDVAFGPLNLGMTRDEAQARAQEVLETLGLRHLSHKAPYHLSAGEKRRVAIAGVLAMDPEILILDEPTTFLDPPAQREIVRLLRELPQPKILISHNVAFARALATRAVFFEKGRVAGEGSVEEIIRRFDWQVDSPQSVSPDHRL
jgi:cobalt/nickel transport system ATP-binding protein